MIIAALPCRTTQACADCGKIIDGPAIRIAVREGRTVSAYHVHPHYQEQDEQRACAPAHPLVIAAVRALPDFNRRAVLARVED